MALFIGLALGIGTCVFARVVGFDRDRAYYPAITMVVASYYVLFAAMGGDARTMILESSVMAAFISLAVVGFKFHSWIVAAALTSHGIFDLVHGRLIANAGMPAWWPGFCASVDIAAGLSLAWLLRSQRERQPS